MSRRNLSPGPLIGPGEHALVPLPWAVISPEVQSTAAKIEIDLDLAPLRELEKEKCSTGFQSARKIRSLSRIALHPGMARVSQEFIAIGGCLIREAVHPSIKVPNHQRS